MKIFPFKAVRPNFELISSPDLFFSTVKYDYPDYLKNGFFDTIDESAIYIYKIDRGERTHMGVIGCIDIEEYINGNVVRHEKTLATKEQTMMKLLLQRQAMVKPVLLGYRDDHHISRLMHQCIDGKKPMFSVQFASDGQAHHFYQISPDDAVGVQVLSAFSQHIDKAYIADGHHRCSTSERLYKTMGQQGNANKYRHLLCAFFPFHQLDVYDYNRVVDILGQVSQTRIMAEMSKLCDIKFLKKPKKPTRKYEMTMYINLEWYRLRWKPEVIAKYEDQDVLLDAELLNHEVFEGVMKIENVGADSRISYVEGVSGIRGIIGKTIKGQNRIGFCLFPVEMDDLVKIADEHKTLPPKSTWFEPRVRNGLIVKEFE